MEGVLQDMSRLPIIAYFQIDGFMLLLGLQEGLGESGFGLAVGYEDTARRVFRLGAYMETYSGAPRHTVHYRKQPLEPRRHRYAHRVPQREYLHAAPFQGPAKDSPIHIQNSPNPSFRGGGCSIAY